MEDVDSCWFYAVAVGRCTGIFTDWDDAMMHTRGFSYAKFKKFLTFDEARSFLNEFDLDVGRGHSFTDGSQRWFAYDVQGGDDDEFPDPKYPGTLVAFCDGSALRNGRRDCEAAFACIFPHNRDWDVVDVVEGPWATSNRAEYLAALAALKRANNEDSSLTKMLYIFSDSKLLVESMSQWIFKWRHNGWQTITGSSVRNQDILEKLLAAQGSRRVVWRKVKGHSGNASWESHWNEVADESARAAARRISNDEDDD